MATSNNALHQISTAEDSSHPSKSTPAAPANNSDTPITAAPHMTRLDSIAIGPATDSSAPHPSVPGADNSEIPVCTITLLLGNGARHPYKLDERYLTKRNVDVPGLTESGKKDPFSISVYTLKELILREWREEWEPQPASPSSIRLIHFGRLLDDKAPLKGIHHLHLIESVMVLIRVLSTECRFNADSPNVVHMSIKPQEMVDDEEASKQKNLGRDRDGEERTAGCHCIIL